jgi:predicted transcriptional regulator
MLEEFPAITFKIDDESFTCYDLVKCMFRLSETEIAIIKVMGEMEALTAQEVAEQIERDRATAYRALEKLVSIGLIHKERRGREGRGYSNYYMKLARKDILRKAEKRLDKCYTAIKSALMDSENDL